MLVHDMTWKDMRLWCTQAEAKIDPHWRIGKGLSVFLAVILWHNGKVIAQEPITALFDCTKAKQ